MLARAMFTGEEMKEEGADGFLLTLQELHPVVLRVVLGGGASAGAPAVTVVSGLARAQQGAVNDRVADFAREHAADGESLLLEALDEAKAAVVDALEEEEPSASPRGGDGKAAETVFVSEWIYVHHLYSGQKKKSLLAWGSELDVTGFTLPGKPGLIVIEGPKTAVQEFSHRCKSMNWQRITTKIIEETVVDPAVATMDDLRKFDGFAERSFSPKGPKETPKHQDMTEFRAWLASLGLEDRFRQIFI